MTTFDPESFEQTRPVPVSASPPQYAPAEPHSSLLSSGGVPHPAPDGSEVLYVPLAVTVGDGFKFGCGFFLAAGLGFLLLIVVLSALFALTSLMGVNLPVGR